ncbi:MAG TPA: hypothetical protein VKR58_14080 [Aquella sp.]|nr:hypothetical protein [Aquella sp.]
MTSLHAKEIIKNLQKKSESFEKGLGDEEVLMIESKFNLTFPPDLRVFLQSALPISNSFVNWRLGLSSEEESEKLTFRLNWPLDGMIFDVKSNDFWFDQWGNKPEKIEDRINLATKFYHTYPKLIPIYSHRYIPSQPNQAGNPVFSVHQMDIVYYGYDLASYFAKEFQFDLPSNFEILTEPNVEIEFWSHWTVYN